MRGRRWTVVDRTRHTDCSAVRVHSAHAGGAELRTFLTPFDRLQPVVAREAWRRLRPRRWLHAIRRAALGTYPFGGLRTADVSGIDLLPYQLEPALATLRHGVTRLLIADAVGLGKTIQAGLIVRELSAWYDECRALIVTPAGLRGQWREELRAHFDIAATNADAAWLRATTRALPADVNPWSLAGVYVVSFDFLKRAEVLRPLEEVTWDIVVVDEAHAAGPATDRRAAIDAVSTRSRRVVLLTATPHTGDQEQFESLCRIGQAGDDRGPIVMFRRTAADAGRAVRRRTALLAVRLSRAERRMHRLLERYAQRIHRESQARDDARATLASIVLRKRALSGATPLLASASRRLELLAGAVPAQACQLTLPLGDEDPLDDGQPDDVLAAPGLSDVALETRELETVVRAARRAAAIGDSKISCLLRLLRRVREPVIIFTEYRDTLRFIEHRLKRAGYAPLTLHGAMSPAERSDTQRLFNATGSILVATDAASEGLNLHHHCRLVVHYELPWSPLRLQQRTGRVDRIGQTRAVHEILLVAADTAERLVLAPLATRAAAARGSTTGADSLFISLTEARVAAAVLDRQPIAEEPAASRFAGGSARLRVADFRREAVEETGRLTRHRAWRAVSPGRPRSRYEDGPLLTVLRRRRCSSPIDLGQVTTLFRVSIQSADGGTVHSEIVAVRFDGVRCDTRDDIERLTSIARAWVTERGRATCTEVATLHAALVAALRQREEAIASTTPAAARSLVQAGLFDRRAIRDREARDRSATVLRSQLDDRVGRLDASSQLGVSVEIAGLLIRAGQRVEPR